MIVLDERLRALRARSAEWAADLRSIALDLDRDPEVIRQHLDLPVIEHIGLFQYPRRFHPRPLVVDGHRFHGDSALEHVVCFEELAAGDIGALMAAPGAPMAGPLVALLGDDDQQEAFFGRLLAEHTWTFLALTEPGGGSATDRLATVIEDFALTGAKRYIGNATRSGIGVVFARSGPGPLGIRAVLVHGDDPGFSATVLPTVGLRAAQLSQIELRGVPLDRSRLLGEHMSAARRGTWSWVRVFNRIRPAVAAMALGIARAAYDYVRVNRQALSPTETDRLAVLGVRIDVVRQLVWRSAVAVDADPADGHLASAAKACATRLAEDVATAALGFFGPGARLDHPLLDKLARDALGTEFMEGTGNVQKLAVHHHLTRRRRDHG
jgi:acyl-CoA dehydrogenase